MDWDNTALGTLRLDGERLVGDARSASGRHVRLPKPREVASGWAALLADFARTAERSSSMVRPDVEELRRRLGRD